ncbi:hypothetical protein [Ktedonospora formicarum]|uniref:hypothetical protein n=1 Tax=Ktedonospora formicarum TaxID=2778364 RepID=UPI001C6928C1|nr:hypothetical protein [Ktedonospora formicarum]
MRAVVYDGYGPPDVLQVKTIEQPVSREDEIRIKIYATAVTRGDCATREANQKSSLPVRLLSRSASGLHRPRQPIPRQRACWCGRRRWCGSQGVFSW